MLFRQPSGDAPGQSCSPGLSVQTIRSPGGVLFRRRSFRAPTRSEPGALRTRRMRVPLWTLHEVFSGAVVADLQGRGPQVRSSGENRRPLLKMLLFPSWTTLSPRPVPLHFHRGGPTRPLLFGQDPAPARTRRRQRGVGIAADADGSTGEVAPAVEDGVQIQLARCNNSDRRR